MVCGVVLAVPGCGSGNGSSDRQAQPATSGPRLSRARCLRLEPLVRSRAAVDNVNSAPLRVSATGTARLSQCRFRSRAAQVTVALDTATDSDQRFANRVVEAIQFSGGDPSRLPRRVGGVGDPGSEYGGAVWFASSAQLLAIRANRLLIVGFYVEGLPDGALRSGAAALARRAYSLTGDTEARS